MASSLNGASSASSVESGTWPPRERDATPRTPAEEAEEAAEAAADEAEAAADAAARAKYASPEPALPPPEAEPTDKPRPGAAAAQGSLNGFFDSDQLSTSRLLL